MQLMPNTARRMERVSKRELYDAKTNIRLGVRFFKQMMDRYNNVTELALAAYNAGPERVDEWLRRYPTDNRMLFVDLIPFKETREYVSFIGRNYYWYRLLYPQTLPKKAKNTPLKVEYSLFEKKSEGQDSSVQKASSKTDAQDRVPAKFK
jgi:soluble lytic murein transglycosylase